MIYKNRHNLLLLGYQRKTKVVDTLFTNTGDNMQYSKNIQVKKVKSDGYGNRIPSATAKKVIAKSGNRCVFFDTVFNQTVKDCELHHIHGRKNKKHKHDQANLIYISAELHRAYHSKGYFERGEIKLYRDELKEWFIEYNAKIYGIEAVEVCK